MRQAKEPDPNTENYFIKLKHLTVGFTFIGIMYLISVISCLVEIVNKYVEEKLEEKRQIENKHDKKEIVLCESSQQRDQSTSKQEKLVGEEQNEHVQSENLYDKENILSGDNSHQKVHESTSNQEKPVEEEQNQDVEIQNL